MNTHRAYIADFHVPRDVMREDDVRHLDTARLTDDLDGDCTFEVLESADIDIDLKLDLGFDDAYAE